MVSVLLIVLVMTMMVLSSSFVLKVSSQMKRINSKLYMNEFARNEPPTKTASDEEIKETKDLIIKKEVEEQEEITKSMRDKLLKEIRDGGGDPNYSKGILIYVILLSSSLTSSSLSNLRSSSW
jgi:anaerobic ribonucleoside-triphosphate reductase